MTTHLLPGIRPEPLRSYLAGLGVIRVLAEQADRNLKAAWTKDGLQLTTSVPDIAEWLAEQYEPTPILSPWNNGSGFGAKDKEPLRTIQTIENHPSNRFAQLRAAIPIAREIASPPEQDKARLVQAFRNQCPESVLPWIDATVVLTDNGTQFPPLLGTGGNDGRLDFSSNFHQRLLDVIDTPRSQKLAYDLLNGTETEQLSSAAIGQFDPAGAGGPGSSRFGAADTLVNPWAYVLCVEGALLFAASAVRRHQFAAGRAAIPFTVMPSPDGSDSGAPDEESRGEVWVPLWSRDFAYPEIRQLFAEARASWRGHQARRATDFYAATRTLGVARGIDRFVRFGLQRRNGLAFVAVPLATVEVNERSAVTLAAGVEDWPTIAARSDQSAAVAQAIRQFQSAHLKFADKGEPRQLAELLAAITTLELAVGRSARARDNTPPRRPPYAGRYLVELAKDPSPELRVAVGLASVVGPGSDGNRRSLRQLLLPLDHHGGWTSAPLVPGYRLRSLEEVLTAVMIWRCRSVPKELRTAAYRGVPGFQFGIPVPADDLHAFAAGRLDGDELDLYLRACLALNWRGVRWMWRGSKPSEPVSTLAVLQPLAAARLRKTRSEDEPELALSPDWPTRLAAGQVTQVHDEARLRLKQAGWSAMPAPKVAADGQLIVAALVPRCIGPLGALRAVAIETKKIEASEQEQS